MGKQSALVSDSAAAFIALCSAHCRERLEDLRELHRTVRYLQSRDTGKGRLSHIVSLRRPCPEDAFYVPRILRTWLYTEGCLHIVTLKTRRCGSTCCNPALGKLSQED